MGTMVEFKHGALSESYEKQANDQGFTFGDKSKWVQDVGFGINCAWIHGCITDAEYNRILQRFQKKILVKNLKRLEKVSIKWGNDEKGTN